MTLSTKTIQTDVCIVGSGPAGMTLANILTDFGISCLVIDQYSRQQIYDRGRAGLLDSKTINILRRFHLDAGLNKEGIRHDHCEFRSPQHSFVLHYGDYCNGKSHYVYPQNRLVDDLINSYLQKDGQLLFKHEAIDIHSGNNPYVLAKNENNEQVTIQCHFIAGCDGYFGAARSSLPLENFTVIENQYPYSWLSILAQAPPSTDHIIYAVHERGFAGHMLRNENISRYYLQILSSDTIEQWSDKRIWQELQIRLAKDGWSLSEGKIIDKAILGMRSYVLEPMRYFNLFLVGDAAHIITPCGAKGLNLAIHDAEVLAYTFKQYFENHNPDILDEYSSQRLPLIWQAQEFSFSMLELLHAPIEKNIKNVSFYQKIKESRISELELCNTTAHDFSAKYVGDN
ncbi:MAG: 4-hydroxybenzoate 3-monooxygenase [Thiohalomonadales bacterium]